MDERKTYEPTAHRAIDEEAVAGGSLAQSPAYRDMDVSPDVERHFMATWGHKLKAITAGVSCLLIGISVYSLWLTLNGSAEFSLLGVLSPLAIILLCGLFAVRGYTISGNQLIIHRLGWSNTVDLSGLSSAAHVPGVMHGSIRTLANGGLFSFAGHFYDSNLGAYRAYVTDGMKSVVLKFADKTIVVSPDEPDEFIAAVTSASEFAK